MTILFPLHRRLTKKRNATESGVVVIIELNKIRSSSPTAYFNHFELDLTSIYQTICFETFQHKLKTQWNRRQYQVHRHFRSLRIHEMIS